MKQNSNILNMVHKKNIITEILLLFGFIASIEISGQTPGKNLPTVLEKDFYKGNVIRVKFLKENTS